jgi:hypothetical protein
MLGVLVLMGEVVAEMNWMKVANFLKGCSCPEHDIDENITKNSLTAMG